MYTLYGWLLLCIGGSYRANWALQCGLLLRRRQFGYDAN
jgi:hypothetical protein